MSEISKIDWTMSTWNPLVGCSKYSEGCQNCYAKPIAERFQKQGIKSYENGFKLTLRPDRLNIPLTWKKPRLIFVDSMCDLFHDDVPLDYIKQVFEVMKKADWHIYQILTKRSSRMRELAPQLKWLPHIMAGVTIESDKYRNRLDDLKTVPSKMKWISLEPLIGRIERLDLTDIDWVIVGGESGSNARPMNIDWVRQIRDWTQEQNKAFWFKQYDETGGKKEAVLDGKIYKEFPDFSKLKPDLFS